MCTRRCTRDLMFALVTMTGVASARKTRTSGVTFTNSPALPEHLEIGVAQQAESVGADEIATRVVVDEAVFAHAEESEIVGEHPLHERDGLGNVLSGERRG